MKNSIEVYEGNFIEDKKNGKGTYYWDEDEYYIGEWKDDLR